MKWKKILIVICCVTETLIIIASIVSIGSISSFFRHMKNFFVYEQTSANGTLTDSIAPASASSDYSQQLAELKESIEGLDNRVSGIDQSIVEMDASLDVFTNDLKHLYINDSIDDVEVEEILQKINEKYDNYTGDVFLSLRTDPYAFELFYKMYLSKEPYYYCNLISAFEKYGVDFDKLDIDVHDLITWDIEVLFMHDNIKNYIDNELDFHSEDVIDDISFYYKDFKINMQRYSDTFDYDSWNLHYEGYTAKELDEKMETRIMNYYKKFIINFQD